MNSVKKEIISVATKIKAADERVWNFWTDPRHIIHWNNATDNWHTPFAENDLRVGGKFLFRMEARDASIGFDFTGEYSKIKHCQLIEYYIADGRKVQILFSSNGKETTIEETFEAENTHPVELQKAGWQAILDNFKKYVGKSEKIVNAFPQMK
jgi:uncharacterized protein YndB with AHSA1/START domain